MRTQQHLVLSTHTWICTSRICAKTRTTFVGALTSCINPVWGVYGGDLWKKPVCCEDSFLTLKLSCSGLIFHSAFVCCFIKLIPDRIEY